MRLVEGRRYIIRSGATIVVTMVEPGRWDYGGAEFFLDDAGRCACGGVACDSDVIKAAEPDDVAIDPEVLECL